MKSAPDDPLSDPPAKKPENRPYGFMVLLSSSSKVKENQLQQHIDLRRRRKTHVCSVINAQILTIDT